MKLALVSYMIRGEGQIPTALLTLAALARQEGVIDIQVLDLPERREEDAFVESLQDCDVVGFSSICSTYNQTIRLCRRIKTANPGIRVILGGPQASLTAQSSIRAFPFVDVVFVGESENSWREYLKTGAAPGTVWRDGSAIRENPPAPVVRDLETIPFPALDLYRYAGRAVTPLEIGRGCPFACSFCASSPYFRRNFRLKPVPRILEEMDLLHQFYGSRSFYFVQDSFSVNRSFVEELCAALTRSQRGYTWYCSARADQVSQEQVAAMKQAGCRGIYFGLETGSQRMQQVINKHLNVADAVQVIQRSAEQGLEITTSMIIGFPNEQPEDLRDSLRVFLDLKAAGHALVQLHVLAPMIGSALSGEGHTLQYDGMPSDFSDTAHVLDAEDRELIQGHKDIFASFWHYENPLIPRQRFLFLAHFLTLASLYFADELRTAAKCSRDALIDRLIEGDMPEPFYSDSTFSPDLNRSVALTGKILNGFARPLVRGAATVVDELCGPCGRCCFEPGGILCGRDEWPEIRSELGKDADRWPSAAPLAGSELIQLNEFRDVPCLGAADGGGVGQTRRACPALRSEDRRWRCVIEGVKPAGCIAYPLKLVLREHAGGAARWLISLEFDGLGNGELCPLEKALRSSPELLDQYTEDVRRRIGSREGAFALAEYNYSQQLASRAVI